MTESKSARAEIKITRPTGEVVLYRGTVCNASIQHRDIQGQTRSDIFLRLDGFEEVRDGEDEKKSLDKSAKDGIIRTCLFCGAEFAVEFDDQDCCSEECSFGQYG